MANSACEGRISQQLLTPASHGLLQVPEGIDWAKLNAYVMDKYRCPPIAL